MTTDIFNTAPDITDFSNARRVPHQKVEMTPELRARLDERWVQVLEARAVMAEAERQSQELAKGYESYQYNPRNISSLSREAALHQIEYVSELIQSGQSEKYMLSTSYNGRITSDFRQYVYWLQQHAKTLEGGSAPPTLAQV